MENKKIVLAYSGGLDTSIILKWLIEKGNEVIAYVADVGQDDDFKKIEEKAYACGASKVYVCDLKEEFISDYVFRALKASATYEGTYLLGTAIARPLIAKKHVEIAKENGATVLCHGATGKGNDQARFEIGYMAMMPEAEIYSPWKDPVFLSEFRGRTDMINYAEKHGIPISVSLRKPFSIDENLLHTSYEAGVLEDPANKFDPSMFKRGIHPKDAPDQTECVKVTFSNGLPVKVENLDTGESHSGSMELFCYLNELGYKHGIGIVDMVENRLMGMKSRGVYVTPGGTILHNAHNALETITLDKEVQHYKQWMASEVGRIIYNGLWFSPEMEFLMAAIDKSQESVNGEVEICLYKGNAMVTSRSSVNSLYNEGIASMDAHGGYDQTDAKGFIKIFGLRVKGRYIDETMGKGHTP
ncbi:MAG: argininosuccinate synthase [Candidatus Methanofastidiosa archaeon]|nr:argininosuccinate synthase [Candidatus Methanofastidiosa archaeon]